MSSTLLIFVDMECDTFFKKKEGISLGLYDIVYEVEVSDFLVNSEIN